MMKRVEHHRLKPSSSFYAMLREFCHRSKNLYNHPLGHVFRAGPYC